MNILEATEDSPMVTKPVNLKSQQFWALCKIRFFRTIRANQYLPNESLIRNGGLAENADDTV
jgi:hypothetical protein